MRIIVRRARLAWRDCVEGAASNAVRVRVCKIWLGAGHGHHPAGAPRRSRRVRSERDACCLPPTTAPAESAVSASLTSPCRCLAEKGVPNERSSGRWSLCVQGVMLVWSELLLKGRRAAEIWWHPREVLRVRGQSGSDGWQGDGRDSGGPERRRGGGSRSSKRSKGHRVKELGEGERETRRKARERGGNKGGKGTKRWREGRRGEGAWRGRSERESGRERERAGESDRGIERLRKVWQSAMMIGP